MDRQPSAFQPLSRSPLWELAARYYRERSVRAWRDDEVPHYVTNNPTIAWAYAEMVFALLMDLRRMGRWPSASGQPLHICELGAGTGRFSFFFLQRLRELCESAGLGARAFRYVLTDQVQENIDFWKTHPRLQEHFRTGVLDSALFDLAEPGPLHLQGSGARLEQGTLELPLVVIANYVFDSVAQDLLYLRGGHAWQCEVALTPQGDGRDRDPAKLLQGLEMHFVRRPLAPGAYTEPWLDRLVNGYRAALEDTCLLLPVAGLRCLHTLRGIGAGCMLLTADKGSHRLSAWQGRAEPRVEHHGSISLDVNYHAFKAYCKHEGGVALFPAGEPAHLDLGACLFLRDAAACEEVRRAFDRCVSQFGIDDFFTLSRHAQLTVHGMDAQCMLAWLRLSRHDPHQFARMASRLEELASSLTRDEHTQMTQAVDRVWNNYYPLGEALDIPDKLARLCYRMQDYERALAHFQWSIRLHGDDPGTLVNAAACHWLLGRPAQARRLLEQVLGQHPGHQAATALAAELAGQNVPAAEAVL